MRNDQFTFLLKLLNDLAYEVRTYSYLPDAPSPPTIKFLKNSYPVWAAYIKMEIDKKFQVEVTNYDR